MADTKISALAAGAPAQSGDLIPIARSGANYSITPGNILGAGLPATLGAIGATSINFGQTTLNYYGEGTWTPSLGGNTTYATQTGIYTRIGRMINVQSYLAITLIGTGSATTINGLPFTVSGTASGSVGTFSTLATNVTGFFCYVTSTIMTFQAILVAGASATNQPSVFGNSASIRSQATYHI